MLGTITSLNGLDWVNLFRLGVLHYSFRLGGFYLISKLLNFVEFSNHSIIEVLKFKSNLENTCKIATDWDGSNCIYSFIYLYKYLLLRVESAGPILSRAFRANISPTKSILGVSGIWKHKEVSNAIRCSTPTGMNINILNIHVLVNQLILKSTAINGGARLMN